MQQKSMTMLAKGDFGHWDEKQWELWRLQVRAEVAVGGRQGSPSPSPRKAVARQAGREASHPSASSIPSRPDKFKAWDPEIERELLAGGMSRAEVLAHRKEIAGY